MGSKTSFDIRRMVDPFKSLSNPKALFENPGKTIKEGIAPDRSVRFSSGKSQKARQDSQKQEEQIRVQQQREDIRLAESKDEIGKRKAVAKSKSKGRSLLTATSPTGVQNLGG